METRVLATWKVPSVEQQPGSHHAITTALLGTYCTSFGPVSVVALLVDT